MAERTVGGEGVHVQGLAAGASPATGAVHVGPTSPLLQLLDGTCCELDENPELGDWAQLLDQLERLRPGGRFRVSTPLRLATLQGRALRD